MGEIPSPSGEESTGYSFKPPIENAEFKAWFEPQTAEQREPAHEADGDRMGALRQADERFEQVRILAAETYQATIRRAEEERTAAYRQADEVFQTRLLALGAPPGAFGETTTNE